MSRSSFHTAFSGRLLWFAGLLLVAVTLVAFASKKARPPKPEELVGVWVGFDSDELEFTRLDLRPDFAGYCARVAPADTILHKFGVDAYRVTQWTVDDWKFHINVTPTTTNSEAIYLRGRFNGFSLRLEVGGTNRQWKRDLILYRETRINASNHETKDKIKEMEER